MMRAWDASPNPSLVADLRLSAEALMQLLQADSRYYTSHHSHQLAI